MDFVNRPVYPDLMGNKRIECVFIWIAADRDMIAVIFLNRLHRYLIDELKASMMIADREFIED